MTITRDHNNIIFNCDGCADYLETGTSEFNDALAHLRDEEWVARKSISIWRHYCPDCKKEEDE